MCDFAMCSAKNCPISKTCRRHADSGTEPDPYRQTYADFQPQPGEVGCDAYWHTNQTTLWEE